VAAHPTGIVHVVEPDDSVIDPPPDLIVEPTPVATARRRYGIGGAMMAGGMLGIEKALELRPAKEEAPVVVASASEPVDIDDDGIDVDIDDETWVYAPPQPRSHPQAKVPRRR
jgi:hypothetical protein